MDRILTISVGTKRYAKAWKQKTLRWSELTSALAAPKKTSETMNEYDHMTHDEQLQIKDVGGFVGGTLTGAERKKNAVHGRTLFTLDADFATDFLWDTFCLMIGCSAVMYSTHKDRIGGQRRIRIIGPYTREVTPDEHEAVSRKLAELVGIDCFDDTTYEPSRLMYWPSVSADQTYEYKVNEGEALNPDTILGLYGPHDEWENPENWPLSSRVTEKRRVSKDRQGDPLAKPGIIGQFNRAYTIPEAIDAFLPDVYGPTDKDDRYTYLQGSSAAGLVLYDDNLFAYSNHATDPISGLLVNAFDLIRIHKFGSLDLGLRSEKAVTELPSHRAMSDFAAQDSKVKKLILQEKREELERDFNITDASCEPQGEEQEATPKEVSTMREKEAPAVNWQDKLHMDRAGNVEGTARNLYLILKNDPSLAQTFAYEEFAHKIKVLKDLPWRQISFSAIWTDEDSACLRNYLNFFYGINSPKVADDVLQQIAIELKYHPLKNYLSHLVWDGKPRIDTLFIDFLGAEDTAYTREVCRKTLLAAVNRITSPGCKFDEMTILYGPPGIGKSTLIQKLAGEWYSENLRDVESKDTLQAMEGRWIMEMGELRAKRRADEEAMKAFLSRQVDIYRPAFGRYTKEHPRQCIFIGTTNDDEFIGSASGDRRFWPITCAGGHVDDIFSIQQDFVDQVWAEAVHYVKQHESLRLSAAQASEVVAERSRYVVNDDFKAIIEAHLDKKISVGWEHLSEREKLLIPPEQKTEVREITSIAEIVYEMFDGDLAHYRSKVRRALQQSSIWKSTGHIGRFSEDIGVQRVYERVGAKVAVDKKLSE